MECWWMEELWLSLVEILMKVMMQRPIRTCTGESPKERTPTCQANRPQTSGKDPGVAEHILRDCAFRRNATRSAKLDVTESRQKLPN